LLPPRRRTIKREARGKRSASRRRAPPPRPRPRRATDGTDGTERPGPRRRRRTAHGRRPAPGPGPEARRRPARTGGRARRPQARRPRAPRAPRSQAPKHRAPRRRASHRTGQRALPAVPRIRPARSRPTRPPGVPRPPTARHAGCRQCRRRPRPGPAPVSSGLRARPAFLARRGPRLPRRTSADLGPASRVPRRPGPKVQAASARGARGPRDPGPARRAPGQGLREPRAPGRVLPGQVRRAPVRRGPARGRVTTRSARRRPAWDRRPRPVLRRRGPASPAVLARAVLVAPLVRVPVGEGRAQAGRAPRMAGRVLVGSRARAQAAPGQAR
jgi:hypothetical protein